MKPSSMPLALQAILLLLAIIIVIPNIVSLPPQENNTIQINNTGPTTTPAPTPSCPSDFRTDLIKVIEYEAGPTEERVGFLTMEKNSFYLSLVDRNIDGIYLNEAFMYACHSGSSIGENQNYVYCTANQYDHGTFTSSNTSQTLDSQGNILSKTTVVTTIVIDHITFDSRNIVSANNSVVDLGLTCTRTIA